MTIRVSGKSISVGDALRGRVGERIDEVLSKYFDGRYSGHVTISKDKSGFRTDCSVHLDSGTTLEADANAADAYASADLAIATVEKRLRRYKSRLKDRHSRKADNAGGDNSAGMMNASSYVIEAPSSEDEQEVIAFNPVIIAETSTRLRRFSVSEAVMELDLSGAPVVVFQHGGSGRVNLIYRRPDGNIGWIDPGAIAAPAT
ncbi:MAG: ribosome-associated translation inhibitor RaiA [Xanthobacteraceae bacterium]|nr:MAG: ribosome-associated translation inhibitor RaiA [Xanthobacteraceae bacterium]